MKKIFFFIILITSLNSNAQTTIVPGSVSGTWPLSGSPYLVQGNIYVPNDSLLTIQAGATVIFQGTYKLLISGRLLAIGNSVDSISFTAANMSAGWQGIRFDNTTSNNDTSKVLYAKLTYGSATGPSPDDNGGGFYINNFSKVIISNCSISDCYATTNGGGICCMSSQPIISNNVISYDTAGHSGGGIYCSSASPLIKNNIITHCAVTNNGGGITCTNNSNPLITGNEISYNNVWSGSGPGAGIYIWSSKPVINYNTISHNTASYCAGIDIEYYSDVQIDHNIISNNRAANGTGGGLNYPAGSSSTSLSYNIICNNSALGFGGGILLIGGAKIDNNLVANNSAQYGGGIYVSGADSANFVNNTIVNNSSLYGGGLCFHLSGSTFQNCVVYGNTANTSGAQVYIDDQFSNPGFYYCDIEGSVAAFGLNGSTYTGTYQNNINADPFFVSPSGGSGTSYNGLAADWSLQNSSPCINSGDPSGTYPNTDLANNPRVSNSIIDIGAYEYQPAFNIMNFGSNNQFLVYPNPAKDEVTLQTGSPNNGIVELYDLSGKLVMKKVVNEGETVDVSNLDEGCYTISLSKGDYCARKKLMIIH